MCPFHCLSMVSNTENSCHSSDEESVDVTLLFPSLNDVSERKEQVCFDQVGKLSEGIDERKESFWAKLHQKESFLERVTLANDCFMNEMEEHCEEPMNSEEQLAEEGIEATEPMLVVGSEEEHIGFEDSHKTVSKEVEDTKPFFFRKEHIVDKYFAITLEEGELKTLLSLLGNERILPFGTVKWVLTNNLLHSTTLKKCFQLLCCPYCNEHVVISVDWNGLATLLIYLLDTKLLSEISLTHSFLEMANILPRKFILPCWIPPLRDFDMFFSHIGNMKTYRGNGSEKYLKPHKEAFSVENLGLVLKIMATCIPYVNIPPTMDRNVEAWSFEDVYRSIYLMTRILLDPIGKLLAKEVSLVLRRCFIVFGGGCEELRLLVLEMLVSIFLRCADSISLQMTLVDNLDETLLCDVSRYFAYNLFIRHSESLISQSRFESLSETAEQNLVDFLSAFQKSNLVYGAQVEVWNEETSSWWSGCFETFTSPREMKIQLVDASNTFDILNTRFRYTLSSYSHDEAITFQRSLNFQSCLYFLEEFDIHKFIGLMKGLCGNKKTNNINELYKIIYFGILSLDYEQLYRMEPNERDRLMDAISILKSSSSNWMNIDSFQLAESLSNLHILLDSFSRRTEISHAGVVRGEEQETLDKWLKDGALTT